MVRRVCKKATNKDPKQIDPKLVVIALLKELTVGLWGRGFKKYQVANNPEEVT